jgi:hypothetical protein
MRLPLTSRKPPGDAFSVSNEPTVRSRTLPLAERLTTLGVPEVPLVTTALTKLVGTPALQLAATLKFPTEVCQSVWAKPTTAVLARRRSESDKALILTQTQVGEVILLRE